jgi:hypothetical protein
MAGIEISPEQINQMVVDAILKSSIGESLRKAIDSQVASLTSLYNNPIEAVVKECVMVEMRRLVTIEYHDKIEAMVREKITEFMVTDVVNKAWDAFSRSLNRGL